MELEVSIYKKLKEFALDVTFQVGTECLGLMGSSGSGKSMTLKCIAGIATPDRGKIILNGTVLFDSEKQINLPPQKRRVGYLFQSYALFPNMSVEENIESGLRARGIEKKERHQRVELLMEQFHITPFRKSYPRQISGGQRQRTALARLLACEPEAILFDEPFSALDEDLKEELQGQVVELLKAYQKPAILVSHDRREIERICQRSERIKMGKIKRM